MNEEIVLIYVGNGAFLPGIPARDLTKEEVREHGGIVELVKTGLYVRPGKEEEPVKENK
jgi:hypothetical protein